MFCSLDMEGFKETWRECSMKFSSVHAKLTHLHFLIITPLLWSWPLTSTSFTCSSQRFQKHQSMDKPFYYAFREETVHFWKTFVAIFPLNKLQILIYLHPNSKHLDRVFDAYLAWPHKPLTMKRGGSERLCSFPSFWQEPLSLKHTKLVNEY